MKYYIQDSTLPNTPVSVYDTVPQLIKHLEGTVQRKFKLNRKQYMQNLIDLGYGYDDDYGVTFVASMGEHFNIGVVQDGGRYIRTNVHDALRNSIRGNETGQ